jgi:hypothetical protein
VEKVRGRSWLPESSPTCKALVRQERVYPT